MFRRSEHLLFHKRGETGFADFQHHIGVPVGNFIDMVFGGSSKHLRNL